MDAITALINSGQAVLWVAGIGFAIHLVKWYANVNSDREQFREFMTRIDRNILRIDGNIRDILSRLPPPRAPRNKSPDSWARKQQGP